MSLSITDYLSMPMLAIVLSIGAYLAGMALFKRLGSPGWCPPVLLASLLLAALLKGGSIDYADYREGAQWLMLLLGPATVALAVPLYQQMHHVRALWKPLLVCLPISTVLAAFYALAIAWSLGAPPELLASLAPKSVTAPIAMGVTERLGGSVSILMGGLLITGVAATACVSLLGKVFRITDQRLLGLALGINGHAIGTVRAFELGPTAGAFASLGMTLTGVLTALLMPLAWELTGLAG
ncbi:MULTISPECIES: LrgB family protein [Halomonas]|uniref:LrgB family protein n=1 Tax=Halomonas TaxID=2745 RepID=UPI001A8EEFFE|nr:MULTISPECIES: LrgB family protein [Halomonas]MED5297063.1 LrgB family protein [Pseudomonadota bacterium]MBN8413065.1 LrgB family protein [Halomonas litopenaei]MBY5925361.1 LrgB family protein [Halomonas sp. DP4Y7-2]MBY5983761.1 LrgB family protein [Halomonas sp. DP5Y7-2]MBY6206585.1 LrgB family protein [Halomonas sp. DP3Y7-2]